MNNNKKKAREEKKKLRKENEKKFELTNELIKYKYSKKEGKRIEQKDKKGIFHGLTAGTAAKKAASAILRSMQLEGKNIKVVKFTLIEYDKITGEKIKEHVFEARNKLNSPIEKWMGKLNKNGKKIMETRYVIPVLKKISSQKLNIIKNKKNKLINKIENMVIEDLPKINLKNRIKNIKNSISKLENNISKLKK